MKRQRTESRSLRAPTIQGSTIENKRNNYKARVSRSLGNVFETVLSISMKSCGCIRLGNFYFFSRLADDVFITSLDSLAEGYRLHAVTCPDYLSPLLSFSQSSTQGAASPFSSITSHHDHHQSPPTSSNTPSLAQIQRPHPMPIAILTTSIHLHLPPLPT